MNCEHTCYFKVRTFFHSPTTNPLILLLIPHLGVIPSLIWHSHKEVLIDLKPSQGVNPLQYLPSNPKNYKSFHTFMYLMYNYEKLAYENKGIIYSLFIFFIPLII